ncbi:TPA: hypothetical protein ACMD08_004470 [Vibrio parahaemolyticus]|uniref:hypothetical protein n=1 Tax=Vibrio parahaemolyticus TaxID=670 RepID=UPI000813D633|nr:hypothetical protein [Vibrio parahaemolyticus]EHR5764787.1 hypothetical protein [Vibrio parahaemolyticus]EHY0932440.1 hypothetical protein [Vibrio parahaemolyticus]EJC6832024.1 hypothetical protein [Vibrio parahaemolyticus]ELA9596041.1 hypothetical protein [Vibrio parahaemolyticus]MDF4381819.1 hypothetical protein [Vibrio parahaemolyticus]
MSFDIAILSLEKRVSNSEASEIYAELLEGNYSNVVENAAIEDLYRELTAMHPEIDGIPDEKIDDIDFCPWSCEFDKSAAHIIISSVWPKSDYVYELVQSLAVKHRLALFSPHAEVVVCPDGSEGVEVKKKTWWKCW